MSFGQQWLNDWEDDREEKSFVKIPDTLSIREKILREVSEYLSARLAGELTDKIVRVAADPSVTTKLPA